jgi:hypothetical protein
MKSAKATKFHSKTGEGLGDGSPRLWSASGARTMLRNRSPSPPECVWELTKPRPLSGSRGALQVAPLRYPGFPLEVGGVGELHAAFLTESRTRGWWQVPRGRKSGFAPAF